MFKVALPCYLRINKGNAGKTIVNMSWELSQKGFEMLKNLEGYRNKPYRLKNEKYYTCCMGHSGPDV